MRKIITTAVPGILVLGAVLFGLIRIRSPIFNPAQAKAAPAADILSEAVVVASGTVRSNQSALLYWQASGTVAEIAPALGDQVSSGQELASLSRASLPPEVILARADLVDAQKALEELMTSKLQQAQALKAVEDAQKALDDMLNPQLNQAQALEAVANAQKAVDGAELQVYILTTPPAQAAVDQTYANLLLAENKLSKTREAVERTERLVKKVPVQFRPRLKKALENQKMQLTRDQIAYDRSLEKYNKLLAPPDPTELAVAQANFEKARLELEQAQRDWERVKEGPAPSEIAVAEAELADARRQWERLKDGPNPDDLAAARAEVAAAQAALDRARITAPFDGRITEVSSQPGDQVEPGSLAFRLDDLSRLLVDVRVSEVDINLVEMGLPVVITFDAVLGQAYHGSVVEVAPVGTETEGVVDFAVTVELADAGPQVKPGMTAAVEILVDGEEDGSGS